MCQHQHQRTHSLKFYVLKLKSADNVAIKLLLHMYSLFVVIDETIRNVNILRSENEWRALCVSQRNKLKHRNKSQVDWNVQR